MRCLRLQARQLQHQRKSLMRDQKSMSQFRQSDLRLHLLSHRARSRYRQP
jgi:hypothetical protein